VNVSYLLGTAVVHWCRYCSTRKCEGWWTAVQYRWRTWISSGTLIMFCRHFLPLADKGDVRIFVLSLSEKGCYVTMKATAQ